jgi:hypothetical protein
MYESALMGMFEEPVMGFPVYEFSTLCNISSGLINATDGSEEKKGTPKE